MAADEFGEPISITANFGHNTLTGCTDCLDDFRISRERLYAVPGREIEEPPALPTDRELHFGRMKIGSDGIRPATASTDTTSGTASQGASDTA